MSSTDEPKGVEDYAAKVATGYRSKFSKRWPKHLSTLIAECWTQNPDERPSMRTVVARLEAIYDQCRSDDVFLNPAWLCSCLTP